MSMWKYVLKRIGLALMTSFIILSLSFLLIKCLPMTGDNIDAQIAEAFEDAIAECEYNG